MAVPLPAFTRFPLDRADHLRRDETGLAALLAEARTRVAAFWRSKPLVLRAAEGAGAAPAWRRAETLSGEATETVFLGLAADGAAVFAAALDPALEEPALAGSGGFEELRAVAGALSPEDGSLLAAARGILAWHESQPFCARCGAPSASAYGGWKRVCTSCAREHFPRVDPVVIMLITRGERVLLGRGRGWPERAYSCLAGFVEPGETLGEAARREAREEAGVTLGEVSYLLSQPWPFPSSLMFGVRAEAAEEALVVDPLELADARWFDRGEIAAVMTGTHPIARTPPREAVAHHLLAWWLENERPRQAAAEAMRSER